VPFWLGALPWLWCEPYSAPTEPRNPYRGPKTGPFSCPNPVLNRLMMKTETERKSTCTNFYCKHKTHLCIICTPNILTINRKKNIRQCIKHAKHLLYFIQAVKIHIVTIEEYVKLWICETNVNKHVYGKLNVAVCALNILKFMSFNHERSNSVQKVYKICTLYIKSNYHCSSLKYEPRNKTRP